MLVFARSYWPWLATRSRPLFLLVDKTPNVWHTPGFFVPRRPFAECLLSILVDRSTGKKSPKQQFFHTASQLLTSLCLCVISNPAFYRRVSPMLRLRKSSRSEPQSSDVPLQHRPLEGPRPHEQGDLRGCDSVVSNGVECPASSVPCSMLQTLKRCAFA